MKRSLVLVVDGDSERRSFTCASIETSGIRIEQADSAREALRQLELGPPDLMLVDAGLPDISGLGLLRLVRESEQEVLRAVLLSSWTSEVDRIIAFEAGFDDFVPRPFSGSELSARVRAILRRSSSPNERNGVDAAGDGDGGTARWERPPTPRELRLFEELVRRRGRVVSRRELLKSVWGPDAARTERVVDAHIKAIRGKLGAERRFVETVRGVGYRYGERRPRS